MQKKSGHFESVLNASVAGKGVADFSIMQMQEIVSQGYERESMWSIKIRGDFNARFC